MKINAILTYSQIIVSDLAINLSSTPRPILNYPHIQTNV